MQFTGPRLQFVYVGLKTYADECWNMIVTAPEHEEASPELANYRRCFAATMRLVRDIEKKHPEVKR